MGFEELVKETPQLSRARDMLRARAAGMLPVKPRVMPEITDQEVAILALQTDFTYDAIRKAFPLRLE